MTRQPRPLRADRSTHDAALLVAGLCNVDGIKVRVTPSDPPAFSLPMLSGRTRKHLRRHVELFA